MIRLILFLVLLIALGLGFSWLADRPGAVSIDWQGTVYSFDLIVMAVAVVALIAAVMVTWAIIRTILHSPGIVSNFFSRRNREQGYKALSSGFIAAGSGDAATARRMVARAGRMLTDEPLKDLLEAQTALLEDKHGEARQLFEDMLDSEDTRILGLRGLYLEAKGEGDVLAARQYAEKANELAPKMAWAGKAKQDFASTAGEWQGALDALAANQSNGVLTKEEAKRERAVLLTANAMSIELSEPRLARKQALEATKLAPKLVPAGTTAARVMVRAGEIRQASKLLESMWRAQPHPEISDAYIHVRPGDSAVDRLKRAKGLEKLRPNHPESHFIIAQAALDARNMEAARAAATALLRTQPTERAFLLMADIEDAEFGDDGRIRQWLAQAVRAPRDATWTADGQTSDHWAPVSPVTGKLDAYEWKVPVAALAADAGSSIDWDAQEADLKERRAAALAAPATFASANTVEELVVEEVATVQAEAEKPSDDPEARAPETIEAKAEPVETKTETAEEEVSASGDNIADDTESEIIDAAPKQSQDAIETPETPEKPEMPEAKAEKTTINPGDIKTMGESDLKLEDLDLKRPDDPGVRKSADDKKNGRFGLLN